MCKTKITYRCWVVDYISLLILRHDNFWTEFQSTAQLWCQKTWKLSSFAMLFCAGDGSRYSLSRSSFWWCVFWVMKLSYGNGTVCLDNKNKPKRKKEIKWINCTVHALKTIDGIDIENNHHIIVITIIISMDQSKRNSLIILKWICSKTHICDWTELFTKKLSQWWPNESHNSEYDCCADNFAIRIMRLKTAIS